MDETEHLVPEVIPEGAYRRVHGTLGQLAPTWPKRWWAAPLVILPCGCLTPQGALCPHDLRGDDLTPITAEEEEALGIPPVGDPTRKGVVRWYAIETQKAGPTFRDRGLIADGKVVIPLDLGPSMGTTIVP